MMGLPSAGWSQNQKLSLHDPIASEFAFAFSKKFPLVSRPLVL
jgi:hypothetical protein